MRTLLLFLLASALVSGQSPQWKAGLSRVNITPDKPILLSGYASRTTPSTGIEADIWVKALALEDAGGKVAVIVTADLIGFARETSDKIASRLEASRNIARPDLLLNASHTHAGPETDPGSIRGIDNPEWRQVSEDFVTGLIDEVVQTAEQAIDNRQPATLSWAQGEATFVFNRREFTAGGVRLGVNPRGPADRSVPVLRVLSAAGNLRAAVFGAGAHGVTLRGDNYRINGDYAGFAQDHIEGKLDGVQAMFIAGCFGDASPHPRNTMALAKQHGATLGTEVLRVLEDEEFQPVEGPLETRYRIVDLPLAQFTRAEIEALPSKSPSGRRFFRSSALKWLDEGNELPQSYAAPFALWRFGEGLTFVGFSGETVVDFALQTEQILGPLDLWLSGYNNDVYGYLVTGRLLDEGGYETRGLYNGIPGLFSHETSDAVMHAIKEMAESTGREIVR